MNINRNQNTNQPLFGNLPFRRYNGVKLFEEFHIPSSEFCPKDYFVSICKDKLKNCGVSIQIDNGQRKLIGESDLTLLQEKVLFNENMDVFLKSNRSMGAGTAMHLAGIMTMLENGMEKLNLYSMGSAVHFHSRFKFAPAIINLKVLEFRIKSSTLRHKELAEMTELAEKSEKWLKNVDASPIERIKEGNALLDEYLQVVLKNKYSKRGDFKFPEGFYMELTRDRIYDNKSFFDKLFENFGIDYKISKD